MSMVTVKVQDEMFQEWIKRTKHAFVYMIHTMVDVANVVRENTIPLTPVETTRLGKSFKWTILTDNSRMKVLQVQMSALNPETGYDYAMTQHRGYHVSKNGKLVKYNYYSKSIPSIDQSSSNKVFDAHGYVNMNNVPTAYSHLSSLGVGGGIGSQYLYRGIIQSQEGAFELIEEDYLSLFTRGNIF